MNLPVVRVTSSTNFKKEVLTTKQPGKVTLYSCGPTVYGFIHIGNLRAAMTSDLFYRSLTRLGYEVNYVRNYTDVDDKILKRAREEGVTPEILAKRYIAEVERDYLVAGLCEPTKKTLVTEHIPEIIEMVRSIIKNGHAYTIPCGEGDVPGTQEVLFSIESFQSYGALSQKKLEDLIAGERVEVNTKKKSPADFTLWKPAKLLKNEKGETIHEGLSWDSPWGEGRPGWHIECSAMALKWLGDEIDIHHGGSDLIFPHHENEIAQSECATGHHPYVRYWLHSAMLNIGSEKMSKSLGNFITARDFLTEFGSEITRMFLLSVHYRSISDFTEEALDQTMTNLQRLYEAKEKATQLRSLKAAMPDLRAENLWGSFMGEIEKCRDEIKTQICNDFNTPGVFAALFTLIREWNRVCAEPSAQATPTAIIGATEFLKVIEEDLFSFVGIGRATSSSVMERIQSLKEKRVSLKSGETKLSAAEIEEKIRLRTDAKKNKDFKTSDEIRDELLKNGVRIKDSKEGTTWEWV